MKKRITIAGFFISGVAISAIFFHFFVREEGTSYRYVRSSDLIYGYLGTKEIQVKYEALVKTNETNLDTLKADYQRAWEAFSQHSGTWVPTEKEAQTKMLEGKRQNLLKYTRYVEEEALEEEEEMMKGVLSQINTFTGEYSREKGWSMVFGTTQQGSLLYGDSTLDVTQELLEALNKHYRGE